MRKTEGGRVPLRPHLFQGNTVTLHSQSGRKLVAGAFSFYGPKAKASFECIINKFETNGNTDFQE